MCPSYMVTREEKHSTRGRAHLLFEMLQGIRSPTAGATSVKEALDLCLACKGCKGDCPVKVDMATYKAEFLSHYYGAGCGRACLRLRADRSVGASGVARARPGNLLTQTPGLAHLAKTAAGIAPERTIPLRAANLPDLVPQARHP